VVREGAFAIDRWMPSVSGKEWEGSLMGRT
jgi:hypothetical protein